MEYAVVIRTKNSEKTLDNCLKSLLAQTMKPKEIVIVDSGSTDKTISIAQNFPVKILKYPKARKFNYSKALNIGIASVSSEYILNLSSHVKLIYSNSVELMFSQLQNPSCAAVSMERTDLKDKYYHPVKSKLFECKIDIHNFQGRAMYNFCALYRRKSWEECCFNEEVLRCEDQDWIYKFLKINFHSIIIREPKVFYENPYYNAKKDAWDYITLGNTIYPYFLSNQYLVSIFQNSVKKVKSGRIKDGFFDFQILYYLFKFKFLGIGNIKSVYNNRLK